MSKIIKTAFSPETFRRMGHELVDQLADYLTACQTGNSMPVLPWKEPGENLTPWETDFTQPSEASLKKFYGDLIAGSLHLHHPRYVGHQVVPPAPLAALTELAEALLNNSMAVYEVGPASSAIEKIVTDWTASVLGMGKQAGGILTSGGSIGNLTGLLAARQHNGHFNTWEEGLREQDQLAVMVSEEAHYSVARAVRIMGWGKEGVVKVPVNRRKEVDAGALERVYKQACKSGKKVIALVGNACSTSTGSYDPIEFMADFCEEHNLWFHVDGAHGGGVVLSDKYKDLARGIERADSVVIDFHKMLLCPALTTAVIFKHNHDSYETFSQKASYLLAEPDTGNWYDIAQRTLECTKKMMGVKIYALLKAYGQELFSQYITRAYDLAREFAGLIKSSGDFELALEPASNIVCFRYNPGDLKPKALDELNTRVRTILKKEGSFYLVQTLIDGRVYLRTSLMNPHTCLADLQFLLETIRRLDK